MKLRRPALYGISVLAALAAQAGAAELERPLFGFEREEVERAFKLTDPENAVQVQENGDFTFRRHTPTEDHEREMYAIRPMRCVQEKASAGRYACKVSEVIDWQAHKYPTFRMPGILALDVYLKTPQANLRMPELLNTAGWFDVAFPRDWTGWDLLRVDVFIENAQAESLMLEVEDDLVEPPVSLTYPMPEPGRWVTLEMDLAQAVKARGLNLAKMNNIWVRMKQKDISEQTRKMRELWKAQDKPGLEALRTTAYVDNIRLCKAGAPCATPVLRGERSAYTTKLPRSYAAQDHFLNADAEFRAFYHPTVHAADPEMPAPASVKLKPAPLRLQPPEIIPIREMIKKGCLKDEPQNDWTHSNIRLTCAAALDADRILVGFDLYGTGSLRAGATAERIVGNNASVAVATTDGGRTWKGLTGTDWPTVVGGNQSKIPPRLWDMGGDIVAGGAFGCLAIRSAHVGYPVDRAFFIRSVFTGDAWWLSPNYFVTGEPRHCHWMWWADVVASPSGRIWMGWESVDRNGYESARTYSILVYCAADGGRTWQSWRGPGFNGVVPPFGSNRRDRRYVKLVPYRGQVAVLAGDQWSWFNGKDWSALETTGAVPWGAVSCGDEIWLSSPSGAERWFDGRTWREFTVPGRAKDDRGLVAVCGGRRPSSSHAMKAARSCSAGAATRTAPGKAPKNSFPNRP